MDKEGNSIETPSMETSVVDKTFVYNLSKKFVRIEYPGLVNDVSKAVETLGGMYSIEKAIADVKDKIELRFHPKNTLNKPCVADRDNNQGLLLKVRKKDDHCEYEIIGYVSENFKFNKAVDFQYLPLVQDTKTDNIEYVYEKIYPQKVPDLEFVVSKGSAAQATLLIPNSFSRFETSHNTLYLQAKEKFNLHMKLRPELFKIFEVKSKGKFKYKQFSHILSISDPNLEIPKEPKEFVMKLIKERSLENVYKKVKQMFDERPMWTKAALQYVAELSPEASKIVLAASGYFWSTGPWRTVWTKLGYDPRSSLDSRIYQTLDFRIRESEGTKLIIRAKRTSQAKYSHKVIKDESSYILSPNCIPPARQMFYQYCDIMLPEIQDMLQRLPKTPGSQNFDLRNGWLPVNFSEHCREIANKYVMDKVHRELVAESIRAQLRKQEETEGDEVEEENLLSYSSGMLNQMQKGHRSQNTSQNYEDLGTVVLSSDDDSDEDIEQDGIGVGPEDEEQAELSDNSEMELDMETVEEINQLILDSKIEIQ